MLRAADEIQNQRDKKSTERVSNMPKVTQFVKGQGRIWTQA